MSLAKLRIPLLGALFILSAGLTSCGGGGGGGGATTPPPVPPPVPPPGGPTQMTGSLEAFLKSIQYGTASDNQWQAPSAGTITSFQAVLALILASNFTQADTDAAAIGYDLIEFTDTDFTPNRMHYVLQEINQVPNAASTGGGTYVFNPGGKNLTIEGPHPLSDTNTQLQSVEVYIDTQAKALLLAGTRRDSVTMASGCQGSFEVADASHNNIHLFQAAHESIEDNDSATIYLQLHGLGTANSQNVSAQCNPLANSMVVNLSESVAALSDPMGGGFIHVLESKINAAGTIAACLFAPAQNVDINDKFSSIFGGTQNTQGRYTNGSADVCNTAATASSARFLHIEQNIDVRSTEASRDILTAHIKEAADDFFP